MADEQTNTTTTTAPAPAAPPPAPAPAAKPAPESPKEEPWIGSKIAKAQKDILRSAGVKVKKKDDPNEVAGELKQKLEERKTLKKQKKELEAKVAEGEASKATLKIFADAALAELPPEQVEAVKKIAGDDPQKQLEQVAALKILNVKKEPKKEKPAPLPAPATTAPTTAAPTPGGTVQQTADPVQKYAEMKKDGSPMGQLASRLFAGLNSGKVGEKPWLPRT